MIFDVPNDKLALVTLETVIQIAAHQRATSKVLIELLSDTDEEANEAIELLNDENKIELDRILEEIFIRHGTIDLRDLFKRS